MRGKIVSYLVTQLMVAEVLSQSQPSLAQYLQLAGLTPYAAPTPTPSYPSPTPNYPSPTPNYPSPTPNYPSPTPNYPPSTYNYPPPQSTQKIVVEAPKTATPLSVPPPPVLNAPKTLSSPDFVPSNLDANVLNNLAIALQLLIVSNILNKPSPELPKLEPKQELIPYDWSSPVVLSLPVQQSQYIEAPKPQFVYESPNAKFLGASGYIEPSVFGSSIAPVRPNPRSNMALMSPYEALGPGSPFSDPILSSAYSPSYSKKNFQSPYASILNAEGSRDIFSLGDLF